MTYIKISVEISKQLLQRLVDALKKIGQLLWRERFVFVYLLAVVLANLSSAYFGPSVSVLNAFLFIGLDLTARDRLHEVWSGRGLLWKMGALITAGSLISWLINRNAGQIAIASLVAFACAAVVDTIAYQLLHNKTYLVKVNGSNVFSAAVDSLVFPTIAFGGFLPWATLGQFAAKVLGGAVWSLILRRRTESPTPASRPIA
jgi:queuosine precursor transporter